MASSKVADARSFSGRRVVAVGIPLALLGAAVVIATFSKFGRGNFTRAARIVEARGRAYELAAGVARCMNRGDRSEVPPSSPPVPPNPPRGLSLDVEKSMSMFSSEVFRCASFHPRGEIHVQIAWRQDDAHHGAALATLDDDDNGTIDFEASAKVECATTGEDRCRALMVTERRLDGR